jgi:hypothetical protein
LPLVLATADKYPCRSGCKESPLTAREFPRRSLGPPSTQSARASGCTSVSASPLPQIPLRAAGYTRPPNPFSEVHQEFTANSSALASIWARGRGPSQGNAHTLGSLPAPSLSYVHNRTHYIPYLAYFCGCFTVASKRLIALYMLHSSKPLSPQQDGGLLGAPSLAMVVA